MPLPYVRQGTAEGKIAGTPGLVRHPECVPTDAFPTSEPDAADLLAQAGWLRSLAFRLVRDEAEADDLVQETWRRALERPPRDRKALPAWLARVARNTAAEEHRRSHRRRARELRAARPERIPATSDVVQRTELHRRLVDALLALEEPFRSVLLLRYFDDLSPKEIARRLGVPAATVRTRSKRGLDRLRRCLDDAHGGSRRAWVLPLVPWARDSSAAAGAVGGTTALVGGMVAMSAGKQVGLVVGVVVVALVGVGFLVVPQGAEQEQRPVSQAAPVMERTEGVDEATLVGRAASASEAPSEEPLPAPIVALGRWGLRGTVQDDAGRPIPGATVEATLLRGPLAGPLEGTRADARGGFTLDLAALADLPPILRAAAGFRVHAWADGFVPSPEDSLSVNLAQRADLADLAPTLILEPGHVLRGRVLDEASAPVIGVQVYLVPEGEQARIVARTGPGGAWRGRMPGAGRYGIRAEATGVGTAHARPLDVTPDRDLDVPDLVLRGEGRIAGVARFPDGTPAAHLVVAASAALPQRFADEEGLLKSMATADAQGRFVLRGLKRGRYALRPDDWRQSDADPIFETGESAATLTVSQRRVLVEVRDVSGTPVAGGSVSGDWIHADGSRDSAWSRLGLDGRYAFWVAPGERLLVSADVAGSNYAEAVIDVGEQPWDRTIVLTLEEVQDVTGHLRLRVTGDDGVPVSTMQATLTTTLTGALVRGLYEVEPDADGLLPPVPAGTWMLELRPGRTKSAMPTELSFPVFERVIVRPDEVTEVAGVARRGGRIRLSLRVPPDSPLTDRDVVVAAARLPSGDPERIRAWVSPHARGWREGSLRFDGPSIGQTLLAPGTYRLSVEAPGHERVEQRVDVVAGEIVDVKVDLETGAAAASTADPADGPAGPEAVDLAATRLGQLQWTDVPARQALQYLAQKVGMELKVTARAQPIVDQTTVNLQIDDIAAETVLHILTGAFGLSWNAVGKTIWIGTADELLPPPR